MPSGPIFLGEAPLSRAEQPVSGAFVEHEGAPWYRIEHADRMAPFFMSVVSDSDHWLFVSSRGGLTAGRRNADSALFPYTTDDRVHDSAGQRGPVTVLHVTRGARTSRWEPFQGAYDGVYDCARSLYKNKEGDRLLFEEVNRTLGLTFRYEWSTSERFGFVRRVRLTEDGLGPVSVRLLDGLLDLLPAGVERRMQADFSTLIDAYKRCELEPDGLALYRLSSVPVDRAEPSESLAVTTVWCAGLRGARR